MTVRSSVIDPSDVTRRVWSVARTRLRVLADMARATRILALALAVLAGLLVLPRGGVPALAVAILGAALIVLLAGAIADSGERPWVLGLALLALLARDALVGAIDVALMTRGHAAYAGDEQTYIGTAHDIWQYWLNPAVGLSDPYGLTSNLYIHLMARTYLLFGEDVVVVKLLNTLFAVAAGLVAYRAMRNLGMPGARWALALLLFFPSVALWSALALKDAWVLFFLLLSFWASSEFVRSRNYLWLTLALLVLMPIASVRLYMLVVGSIALLAGAVILMPWRDRLLSTGLTAAGIALLFGLTQPFADLGPNPLYIPILVRGVGAQGARSSFVEPFPVVVGDPGEQFRIGTATGATPPPGETPRVIEVQPGTQLVVVSASPPASQAPAATAPATSATPGPASVPPTSPTPAAVRPGDIVVVAPSTAPSAAPSPSAPATALATPTPAPTLFVIEPGAKNTVGLAEADPDQASVGGSFMTNLKHLPLGILYSLFAPFPWTARTPEQLATIPEMLVWYACLVLAAVGFVWLLRRRDLRYATGVAMIVGLVLVLSLVEANVGTLVRSRAMLIPYVLLLSGVGIDRALPWARGAIRIPRRTRRSSDR